MDGKSFQFEGACSDRCFNRRPGSVVRLVPQAPVTPTNNNKYRLSSVRCAAVWLGDDTTRKRSDRAGSSSK